MYATGWGLQSVFVWPEGSVSSTQSIFSNLSNSHRIFVTINGDVYPDNWNINGWIKKWSMSANNRTTTVLVSAQCNGLFVDVYNSLYCSVWSDHLVLKRTVDSIVNTSFTVAGTGTTGSTSNMLSFPCGIFVDIDLSLYVADYGNKRVQLFQSGQLNGTTVAGDGAPGTIVLYGPAKAILDGNGYLFIVDSAKYRIVGSGPNGFRCIAACSGSSGSAANQLFWPYDLSFDSHGNFYVTDTSNNRLRKFTLARNSCGELFQATLCRRILFNYISAE